MTQVAKLAKIVFVCPRCGMKKSVTDSNRLILCPRCGAGMREKASAHPTSKH